MSEQPESIADRVSREIVALLPPGNMVEPLLRQAAVKAHLAIAALERRVESAERDENTVSRINNLAIRVNTKLSNDLTTKQTLIARLTEDNAKLVNACDAKDDRIAELEIINRDLATLVRRLCHACEKTTLVDQANDYLKRKNLQGSILR